MSVSIYTLPANGFTAPDGKQFKAWSVGGVEKAVGSTINVTANTTVTAVWEDIPVVTYTVSGTATSFGSDTDNVILQLIAEGYSEAAYEASVKGDATGYSIAGVLPGTYTMKVMKTKHATREYTITVGTEALIQDVEIWLYGDVNRDGKVDNKDSTQINRYSVNKASIFGSGSEEDKAYRLIVANINNDLKVDNKDSTQINRYSVNKSSIFNTLP